MIVTCKGCNETRELKKDEGKLCKKCCNTNRAKHKKNADGMYERECKKCNTPMITKHPLKKSQSGLCRSCASKEFPRSIAKGELVKHSFTCTGCEETFPTVRRPDRKKTTLCGKCSRSANGKANAKPEHLKFKSEPKPRPRKKYSVVNRPKKDVISKQALELAIAKNRAHKKFLEAEVKPEIKTLSQDSMDDMIAQYCKTHTIIPVDYVETRGSTSCMNGTLSD